MHKRTVSIVGAIIIVGGLIAFAGDLDPPQGPIGPTMHTLEEIYAAVSEPQCCSPRPEDIRSYWAAGVDEQVQPIIPTVEGPTGFIITDFTSVPTAGRTNKTELMLYVDGEFQRNLLSWVGNTVVWNSELVGAAAQQFKSGIVVPAGAEVRLRTITGSSTSPVAVTISGYVY